MTNWLGPHFRASSPGWYLECTGESTLLLLGRCSREMQGTHLQLMHLEVSCRGESKHLCTYWPPLGEHASLPRYHWHLVLAH